MKMLMQKLCSGAMIAAAAIGFVANANAQGEQQVLIDQATTTLSNFMRDPEMKWLQQNIGRAKAVLISPEIVKAGFIVGGSGGRAVLVARNGGKWVGPAFYTLATASIGFQAGVAASEMVTLVMTDKGMNSMMASSFKFGGDASVARPGRRRRAVERDGGPHRVLAQQGRVRRSQPRRHGRVEQLGLGQGVLRQGRASARHPHEERRPQQGRGQAAR